MKWEPKKIWKNDACWIIGGGASLLKEFKIPNEIVRKVTQEKEHPSLYSDYFESIKNKNIIGINNTYQLGDWIDVLFFGDCSWYRIHQKRLIEWPGLKVSCCPKTAKNNVENIKFLQKDKNHRRGISSNSSSVSWNYNSGAAAISLAFHFGVRKIYLLGYDMANTEIDGMDLTHWHDGHLEKTKKKKKPPYKRHLMGFPEIAKDAEKLGIEIYNVNKNSNIKQFEKISLKDALSYS